MTTRCAIWFVNLYQSYLVASGKFLFCRVQLDPGTTSKPVFLCSQADVHLDQIFLQLPERKPQTAPGQGQEGRPTESSLFDPCPDQG